jgi:hypothetical protein
MLRRNWLLGTKQTSTSDPAIGMCGVLASGDTATVADRYAFVLGA